MRTYLLIPALIAMLTTPMSPLMAEPADNSAYGRRLYRDKAQCSFCHGWAADGSGEPQSNGGAANLRQSSLNRDQLVEVISCGRPGTPMPHYDELAYTDQRCYGVTEAELGAQSDRGLSFGQSSRPRRGNAGRLRGDVRARCPLLRRVPA